MFFSHMQVFLAIPCWLGFLLAPSTQKLLYLTYDFLGYCVIPGISKERGILICQTNIQWLNIYKDAAKE